MIALEAEADGEQGEAAAISNRCQGWESKSANGSGPKSGSTYQVLWNLGNNS